VVVLKTRQLGRLDRNGVFKLERRALDFTVNLVREGGEWRISNPPAGLLMRSVDFKNSYRAVGVAYVDASSNMLVNDRRWVLSKPESALPGRVIGLLLGDPSEGLADAVVNELRGARIRTNVTVGPDGVLTVDLTAVQPLNDTQRELAAAQIVRSIDDLADQNRLVRILVDGQPLVSGRPEWRPVDAAAFEPEVELSAGLPGLVVTGAGEVVQIGTAGRLPGVAPPVVQSIAQSANVDRQLLAAVAIEGGRPRLWVGQPDRMQPVDLPAETMSEPTWRGDRDEVWVVVDGNRVMAVTAGGGQPQAQPVDAAEFSRHGRISGLRISRDGVRVAAIVDDDLMLGSIVGARGQSGIRNRVPLEPPNPAQLVDVDWIGTDVLVMATASRDTPVYEASVDGFAWHAFGTSNLTPPITRIAAAFNRPVLVADQNGVWQATTATPVWQPVGHGQGAVPFYPG
jgi:hypothetical protein